MSRTAFYSVAAVVIVSLLILLRPMRTTRSNFVEVTERQVDGHAEFSLRDVPPQQHDRLGLGKPRSRIASGRVQIGLVDALGNTHIVEKPNSYAFKRCNLQSNTRGTLQQFVTRLKS